jgi:hypothetical protein
MQKPSVVERHCKETGGKAINDSRMDMLLATPLITRQRDCNYYNPSAATQQGIFAETTS